MPDIILSLADFRRLSEGAQKEIWLQIKNGFDPEAPHNSTGNLVTDEALSHHGPHGRFYIRLTEAREFSHTNYSNYLSEIDALHAELPKIVTTGAPIKFQALSVEVAIAVLIGLSEDSLSVITALLSKSELTRAEMAEILGGAQKINGTVGSINRRLSKRFNTELYGKSNINKVKLIEFDTKYRLSCDPLSLKLALYVVRLGYEPQKGNLTIKFEDETETAVIHLEALAVQLSLDGKTYIETFDWDYTILKPIHEDRNFSVDTARTLSSATLAIQTSEGEEWVNDQPHFYSYRIIGNPGNFLEPSKISVDKHPIPEFWKIHRHATIDESKKETSIGESTNA